MAVTAKVLAQVALVMLYAFGGAKVCHASVMDAMMPPGSTLADFICASDQVRPITL